MNVKKNFEKTYKSKKNIIKHYPLYNIVCFLKRCGLHTGIIADKVSPYILSSLIMFGTFKFINRTPFYLDTIEEPLRIKTIDTSYNRHEEHSTFDYDFDGNSVEYSTAWSLNNQNKYQRQNIVFRINDSIDLTDADKILNLSLEELINNIGVKSSDIIVKNVLGPEDDLYIEDCVIVKNTTKYEDIVKERIETVDENSDYTLLFIVVSLITGIALMFVKKHISKDIINEYLNNKLDGCKYISKGYLECLKKDLEICKRNMDLLTNDEHETHKLRKDM